MVFNPSKKVQKYKMTIISEEKKTILRLQELLAHQLIQTSLAQSPSLTEAYIKFNQSKGVIKICMKLENGQRFSFRLTRV